MSVAAPPEPPRGTGAPNAAPGALPEVPADLPRSHATRRALLGCLLVLLASAVAGAVFAFGELRTLRDALSRNTSLNLAPGALATAGYGAPETILLVGNDQRKHTTTMPVLPHSNEMLLVRFDPSKPYISMMSVPRELEVTIDPPGEAPVTTRLNYAYTAGGIPLLVSTIKKITGLAVDHVVSIDFNQFQQAVDEMGCVYSTVDRRYFHVNVPGGQQYFEINLQPGYQRMCGSEALQFVSYRHDDTSLVRDARDQSFLLDVKKEYGPTLVDNAHKFEQIFGQSVETDPGLHTTGGILNLLGTLISSSSLRVRQVPFQVNLLPNGATSCACDTATPQQIAASVHAFLNGGSTTLPKKSSITPARKTQGGNALARLPLVPTPTPGLAQARAVGAHVPFPVEFPRVEDRGGSATPIGLRRYLIQAPGGTAYPVYVAVFSAGALGQYYDVQGMQWTTAPLFDSPDQTVQIGARTYNLYYEGQHLQTVAWFEHGAVYWVRNSLLDSLGNGELLGIAEQTKQLTDPTTSRSRQGPGLRVAAVPPQPDPAARISLVQFAGSVGGLLALAALPLLGTAMLKRRRELLQARVRLQAGLTQERRLVASVAALAGGGPGAATAPPLAGDGPASAPAPEGLPSSVNAPSSSRLHATIPVMIGSSIALLAAAAALGVLVNVGGGRTITAIAKRHHRRSSPLRPSALPSAGVSILNAGSAPGAARALALKLRFQGIRIENVGNLDGAPPPATEVEYAPGEQGEAVLLARILRGRSATIVPIDPVAQAAAGGSARLVVVLP